MLISTKGRYALRVLVDLAETQKDTYVPLKDIAQRQDISEKYLEAILKTLVQSRVLVGLRGKGGGYRLGKAPEQITIGSILRLTEGAISPVACLGPASEPCPRMAHCRTLPMWQKLDRLITGYLDSVTIADLMAQPENTADEKTQ